MRLTAFHREWPYWLDFCDLNQDGFRTMVMCCLPGFTVLTKDERPVVGVKLNPMELLRFFADNFGPMNEMCHRAGLSVQAIYHRTKAVMEFFGFPCDVPRPE